MRSHFGHDLAAEFSSAVVHGHHNSADLEAVVCTRISDLFDDSLGKPPVTSYEQLIRWDTGQIVDALR